MNNRMLVNSVLFSLALGLTPLGQAQVSGGTTTLQDDTPSVTPPPPLATPNPPTTPSAPDLNPSLPTLQDANVTGQWQEAPAGVPSQGGVGTAPGSCPCSITTPKNRPPGGRLSLLKLLHR